MGDAAKLWLRIFECGPRTFCLARYLTHVIVRWIGRALSARQDRLCLVAERRDDRLVRFRIAAEQTVGHECFEVQAIDERAIAFRRSTYAGQENIIARLYDRTATATEAAATAVATRNRCTGIFVGGVLPPIPKFARRGARFQNPRPRA